MPRVTTTPPPRGFALWDNTTGSNNTALGASALFNNMTGEQ